MENECIGTLPVLLLRAFRNTFLAKQFADRACVKKLFVAGFRRSVNLEPAVEVAHQFLCLGRLATHT
jgi:hypothetical protein